MITKTIDDTGYLLQFERALCSVRRSLLDIVRFIKLGDIYVSEGLRGIRCDRAYDNSGPLNLMDGRFLFDLQVTAFEAFFLLAERRLQDGVL